MGVPTFLIHKVVRTFLLIQVWVQFPLLIVSWRFGRVNWFAFGMCLICVGYFGGLMVWRASAFAKSLHLARSRGVTLGDLLRLFCHRRIRILGQFTAQMTPIGSLRIWDRREISWVDGIICHPFRMPWPDILVLYVAAPASFYHWCRNVYL